MQTESVPLRREISTYRSGELCVPGGDGVKDCFFVEREKNAVRFR